MTLEIDFEDEGQEVSAQTIEMLDKLLKHCAKELDVQNAELSVMFVDNDRIQEINAMYRDKDQPTDVISFALEEEGEGEVVIVGEADLPRVLGDIVISVPKAVEQAADYGHSFEREIGFLAVHGLLHLLGYDHMTEADESEMFGLQEKLLDSFGLTRSS
ncbi:rRNA maturation RNase YbeY [Pullulanibacillus sp. KACC 23026]|uniref:rRNA maturation RNase YbeY n=1 Tax=Pullulanibacillus sp. KACC 23026 TaxID=3028315 RepID=UPI0023AF61F8|nr:rRNA maturation RNase YbeY [Pullulanibacillus sp. KACC 23026]WEG14237.1 rRNA maturation RNase YbeY [Pullulanibacillus sp. KACC 23026]